MHDLLFVSRLIKTLKLTGRRRFGLRAVALPVFMRARDNANARHDQVP